MEPDQLYKQNFSQFLENLQIQIDKTRHFLMLGYTSTIDYESIQFKNTLKKTEQRSRTWKKNCDRT